MDGAPSESWINERANEAVPRGEKEPGARVRGCVSLAHARVKRQAVWDDRARLLAAAGSVIVVATRDHEAWSEPPSCDSVRGSSG